MIYRAASTVQVFYYYTDVQFEVKSGICHSAVKQLELDLLTEKENLLAPQFHLFPPNPRKRLKFTLSTIDEKRYEKIA